MFHRSIKGATLPSFVAIGVAAAVGISACGSSGSTSDTSSGGTSGSKVTKVTEAGFKVMSMAPIYVAQDRGFFTRNGLDFTFTEISSGKLGVAALISGSVQFVDLGADDVVNLHNQGRNIRFFYNLEEPMSMDFVMSKKAMQRQGITTSSPVPEKMRALQGLTIGITAPGAPTDLYPRYYMRSVGADPSKSSFVPVGNGETLTGALRAGRIDGFMLSPPDPYVAQQQGTGDVIIKGDDSLPVFRAYDFTSVAVQDSWARSHPQLVTDYSNAVSQASQWMRANPDAAERLLADNQFKGTDPATLKLSFNLFLEGLNTTGHMSSAAVANQVNVLSSLGELRGARGIPMSDLMTTAYDTKE